MKVTIQTSQVRAGITAALVLIASSLHAQQAGTPGPAPVTPQQTNVPKDAPLNPALPTIFIVGDSTARNGADLGWGDHFAQFFDTSKVNIANRAVAGRSSRSYYNEGLWDKVLAEMKPGDYVLIQMGHNDGGTTTPQDDTKARNSYKGVGEEIVEYPLPKPFTTGPLAGKTTENIHSYGWYLRKYITDIRAKKAHPILLTVTIRNIWTTGPAGTPHIERDMGFRDYEYQVAAGENVPVVDMATIEAERLEKLGKDKVATLFPVDHTHTSPEGANLAASCVVAALREEKSPLVQYLK